MSQCGNYGNLLSLYFGKNFVELTYLQKKLLNMQSVHFSESKFLIFLHCDNVKRREIISHWTKISSNHLFSNFFSETNAFTKFLRKKCEREFLQFPQFRQINSLVIYLVKTLLLRNFCQKCVIIDRSNFQFTLVRCISLTTS